MSLDLTKHSAYVDKTPYEVWQEAERVPIYKGLAIDDLATMTVGTWKRKGAAGAFINLLGRDVVATVTYVKSRRGGKLCPSAIFSKS